MLICFIAEFTQDGKFFLQFLLNLHEIFLCIVFHGETATDLFRRQNNFLAGNNNKVLSEALLIAQKYRNIYSYTLTTIKDLMV